MRPKALAALLVLDFQGPADHLHLPLHRLVAQAGAAPVDHGGVESLAGRR